MARRLSGVQKEVLALYRKVLREAQNKDTLQQQSSSAISFPSLLQDTSSTTHYAAQEFRKQASTVKRSDFKRIEYMIRKGEKQVKLLKMPGVKVVGGTNQQ